MSLTYNYYKMLQIKLHTHWLDVDKNTTIQWEIENPLFTQGELLGDVSGNINNLAIDAARLLNLPYKQVLTESVDDIFSVLYYENMKIEAQQRERKENSNK